MPNHCENDLYINGPKDQVDALLSLIGADKEQPEFNFEVLIPYPAEFAQRDADARSLSREDFLEKYGDNRDGFNSGGYEWRLEHWGTKWGAYDVARRDYGGVCLSFQTAWSPAPRVIEEMHRKFPALSLSLEYFECGMGFSGGVRFDSEEYADDDWVAGVPSQQWHSDEYRGTRGG